MVGFLQENIRYSALLLVGSCQRTAGIRCSYWLGPAREHQVFRAPIGWVLSENIGYALCSVPIGWRKKRPSFYRSVKENLQHSIVFPLVIFLLQNLSFFARLSIRKLLQLNTCYSKESDVIMGFLVKSSATPYKSIFDQQVCYQPLHKTFLGKLPASRQDIPW